MRFCSASGIAPAEVDQLVVERFKGYRAQSGAPTDDASGRRLIRAWNSNVGNIQGWPAPAQGAGGEAHHGAAVDGASRGPSPGS
jgi:hypothetical protein